MVFEMVDHLSEVMGQTLKVDLAWDWAPSEVEMILLVIGHLGPEVGARLLHDPFD